MTLAEFRDLCEREWGEARSDVTSLSLTDESCDELHRDVIMDGGRTIHFPLLVDEAELEAVRAGGMIPRLVNHITRSVVKVTGGASVDSVEVYRYYARPHPAGIPCT